MPLACCPHCHEGDLEWDRTSGKGVITSYTLLHRPQHEAFELSGFSRIQQHRRTLAMLSGPAI
jgi:uncharacterized OB-fold protein